MKWFSVNIRKDLAILYNHYLSDKFIKEERFYGCFKVLYPLNYWSRKFDKPSQKTRNGACVWCLDDKFHRVGKPACIYSDGSVECWENGEMVYEEV